ncbi:Plasmodium exported protein, unknown function [Plasmodium gonderi]|uniref:Uncharacterized protein n=1 Tax=Plasmodium gonderi TaxID=77519 RepID=A0A1Y1JK18_PLAGO|nr:Plasmodium exported protein, unknown function [Plasmodium gonderi]GAW82008.1 Plasmodium exported protein, unknown function [Plasmodium gonderi]
MMENIKSLNFFKVATTIIILVWKSENYGDSDIFSISLNKNVNRNGECVKIQRILAGNKRRRDSIFTDSVEDLLAGNHHSRGREVFDYNDHMTSRYDNDEEDDDYLSSRYEVHEYDFMDTPKSEKMNSKHRSSSRNGRLHDEREKNKKVQNKKHVSNRNEKNHNLSENNIFDSLDDLDNYEGYYWVDKRIMKKSGNKNSMKELTAHGVAALSPLLILSLFMSSTLLFYTFIGSVCGVIGYAYRKKNKNSYGRRHDL